MNKTTRYAAHEYTIDLRAGLAVLGQAILILSSFSPKNAGAMLTGVNPAPTL